MENKVEKNNHSLNQLQIRQLKEQRRKIITNAVFVSFGVIDIAFLKMLSNTVGTDDMTVNDLIFLLLGGSSSFLGLILMGINTIDYMDMKKEVYTKVKSKKKYCFKKILRL